MNHDTDQRLMRYATAIARDELDYLCGPEYPLPVQDHDSWVRWKQTATVVIEVADREHPPPPGSREKELPADILALIVCRPYVSTACETAQALESATVRHPDRAYELKTWAIIKHKECRLNNKHTGILCICGCPHHAERQDP